MLYYAMLRYAPRSTVARRAPSELYYSVLCYYILYYAWQWLGERRLKNTVMVLEWIPDTGAVRKSAAVRFP